MGYADTSKIRSRDSFPKDPWHANTMPARYYVDPGIYEREKEAVFYSTWQLVGSVRELPDVGSYITATVIDEQIFVTRDANRRLRGYYNVCRHRAGRLVKGSGTQPNGVIACPVHGWVYDLEGRLTQARGTEELPDFDKSTICLQEIRVEEFAKFVFVNLDPGATALKEIAGELEAELRRDIPELDALKMVCRQDGTMTTNWKVVVDNFNEAYHAVTAHPAMATLIDYDGLTWGAITDHYAWASTRAGSPNNLSYEFRPDDPVQYFKMFYLWPNTMFVIWPGAINLGALTAVPLACDSTIQRYDHYMLDDTLGASGEGLIKYLDEVANPEDYEVIEAQFNGLASRAYNQGRLAVDERRSVFTEEPLYRWHSTYLKTLGELDGLPA